MYAQPRSQPINNREFIARQFIAAWLRRHPDYGFWAPRQTTSTLATNFRNDPDFPGIALCDFLGRPDADAIGSAIAAFCPLPNGSIAGLGADLVRDSLVVACDWAGADKRNDWKALGVAGLIIGGGALLLLSQQGPPGAASTTRPTPAENKSQESRRGGQSMVRTKRVFIAFAKEDERIRDLIKGQSINSASPFEYVDMSVKEPYSSEWKERVRTRIRGSDGVIALLSKATLSAAGELWEIQCAVEEKKPLLGLYIYKDDHSTPSAMGSASCIGWTWEGIAKFIDSL